MTEPSQYFKGRTVQEQMNEVVGYVDKRAEEVAAAKAGAVLQPAEAAKTAAQAAAEAAEAAKDTTLAALPEIRQDISGLKAEDTALDGRLNTVELKVQTAEGNIVTIQGKITEIENKNAQQDSAIAALQTADGQNVKLTGSNAIGNFAVLLTGNQDIAGDKNFLGHVIGNFRTGRITATDNLDIASEYDGAQIYYIYMSQVNSVVGLPSDIEGGGAILLHSREYGYGDTTNNYVFYLQVLFSSSGKMYTRRHVSTTSKSTSETTWGKENWKMFTYTEVTAS